jgi:hypothetical protein
VRCDLQIHWSFRAHAVVAKVVSFGIHRYVAKAVPVAVGVIVVAFHGGYVVCHMPSS